MPNPKCAAVLLLLIPLTAAADDVTFRHARYEDTQLAECTELTFAGMSPEDILKLRMKLEGSEGQTIQEPCEKLKERPLGICTFHKADGKKTSKGTARFYTATAFGKRGYETECKQEIKGQWITTTEGWKVRAAVLKEEARVERLKALPLAECPQVAEDYDANVVAADTTYKGKTFAVSGTVQKVDKDFAGRTYIQAAGGNRFIGVHLRTPNKKFLGALTPGDEVWLECIGVGQGHLDAPTFACEGP